MDQDGTTKIISRCLCGTCRFEFNVSNSELPLTAGFCHCTSCRHATGTMNFCSANVPAGLPSDVSQLTKYAFSPRTDFYFCSTCGATMFADVPGKEELEVAVGTIEDAKGLLKFEYHHFVGDTKDGGVSDWIPSIKGIVLERNKAVSGTEELPVGWQEESAGQSAESVDAWCHCKGVRFQVTKANEESENAKYGDPKHAGLGPWWLEPTTRRRFRAGSCVCDECRLASGNDIMSWSFIPDCNLRLANGSPLPLPETFGTLKQYKSSKEVLRYFCGTCGATVFWRSEGRPHLLDVAPALFDAVEGSRAESFLWWDTSRGVSNSKDGLKRDTLTSDVMAGMKSWREKETNKTQ